MSANLHDFTAYRAPLVRVNRKRPCPVCGKPDNCSIREDGSAAYCRRSTHGDKQGRDGGWLHIFRDDFAPTATPRPRIAPSPTPTPERAPVERTHAVYTDLRRLHLVLSEQHRANLKGRGLSDGAIEVAGYRSTPPEPFASNVARALAATHDLQGVPGFYRDGDAWRMVDAGIGFYVPVRDHAGRICGMQIRRDEGTPKYLWFSSAGRAGGASSGAPVHFAKSHLLKDADEVTITEGALKAEIAAHLLGAPVIGVAGVSTFGDDFAANLKQRFPRLLRVLIAYDSDLWRKPEVARALERLAAQLTRARFSVRVRTWSDRFKGFDDYLVAQLHRLEGAA
jgi:hypothetical protein